MWNFTADSPKDCSGIIFDHVAGEYAQGGERSREGWGDDVRNAEGFGKSTGVKASGTAEGNESEVSRVASALDGDNADGLFHGGVHDANYSGGEFFQREIGAGFLEPLLRNAAGAIEIESKVSAEKARGLQTTEEKIGIGHSGLRAPTVTDRAGIGSSGFGADAEDSGSVEAGERASTGADGMDVEHGNADGEASDLGVVRGFDFTFDERDIGRRASHVESDDVVEAARTRGGSGPNYASGGPGKYGADGFAGGGGEGGDATAGLHDEDTWNHGG